MLTKSTMSVRMCWPRLYRVNYWLIKITRRQIKKHLFVCALSKWQERWSNFETCRMTYAIFSWINTCRQQGEFCTNHVLSGYVTFCNEQAFFLLKFFTGFCRAGESMIRHCLYMCALWGSHGISSSRKTIRFERAAIYVYMTTAEKR